MSLVLIARPQVAARLAEFVPGGTSFRAAQVCAWGNKLGFPLERSPRGPKYVRRTLYLDARLVRRLKNLAESESWQLADLTRPVITVVLTFRYLYEVGSEAGSNHRLIAIMKALNYFGSGTTPRRYSQRGFRGEWVTVHLPADFLQHVGMYAHGHGRTRNSALSMFLRDGLLCYFFGYKHFLKTATEASDHEAATGAQNESSSDDENSIRSGS